MRSRGMIIGLAFVLAAIATLTVFLYVRGVEEDAESGGDLVSVIVSEQDIPAGTDLDELITDGAFSTASIDEDAVIPGAVTNLSQIEGRTTSAAILEGEQIPSARLQGSDELPGGALGISEGYTAMSVALDSFRTVAGEIQEGDHVTIYATFEGDRSANGRAGQAATVVLVPSVRVLRFSEPGDADFAEAGATQPQLTLEILPKDAQKLVFAQERGSTYMALLPPGQKAPKNPPVTLFRVVR